MESLLSFVVDDLDKFQTNSDIHSISTGHRYNHRVTNTKLGKYKNGVYYSGIKLFGNIPPNFKSIIHDLKIFKPALKVYILSHS
jgi:hypothetical protein